MPDRDESIGAFGSDFLHADQTRQILAFAKHVESVVTRRGHRDRLLRVGDGDVAVRIHIDAALGEKFPGEVVWSDHAYLNRWWGAVCVTPIGVAGQDSRDGVGYDGSTCVTAEEVDGNSRHGKPDPS